MMVLPLVQLLLMWAYLGEVMDEQRDSTTSDGTILPLRMVANILRLRLDVGWVLLIVRVREIARACCEDRDHVQAGSIQFEN